MGCGASTANKVEPFTPASAPAPASEPPPPPGIQQRSIVTHENEECIVQYVSSKNLLDLKRTASGEVLYGIKPEDVTPLRPETNGAEPQELYAAPAPEPPAAIEEPMDDSAPLLELDGEPLAKPGGSGALVYKCKLAGVNDPCAVKFLATKGGRESNLEVLRAEVALCKTIVDHAHIVRFHHLSTCRAIGGLPHIALVMELLPTSLETLIDQRAKSSRPFGVIRLASIATQLASALAHLHSLSPPMLHRDVKPANCFFPAAALAADNEDATDLGLLRLGDFDTAIATKEPVVDFIGTPSVSTPPEMFAQQAHHTQADVWAYGMTLQWCILLGDCLGEATMEELEERITAKPNPRLPIFESVDESLSKWPAELEPIVELARKCCAAEQGERPRAEELGVALAPIAAGELSA